VFKTKEQVRKETLTSLKLQDKDEALKKSKRIKKRLFSLPEFKKAKVVMLYASMADEVSTEEIIDEVLEMGKRVVLPLLVSPDKIVPKEITSRKKDLEKGSFGIYEPKNCQRKVQLGSIDLVIVPGVAFDKKNVRLGRGKGYYDEFLSKLTPGVTTVGLAFDIQIVDILPKDSHDKPVSKVITN